DHDIQRRAIQNLAWYGDRKSGIPDGTFRSGAVTARLIGPGVEYMLVVHHGPDVDGPVRPIRIVGNAVHGILARAEHGELGTLVERAPLHESAKLGSNIAAVFGPDAQAPGQMPVRGRAEQFWLLQQN